MRGDHFPFWETRLRWWWLLCWGARVWGRPSCPSRLRSDSMARSSTAMPCRSVFVVSLCGGPDGYAWSMCHRDRDRWREIKIKKRERERTVERGRGEESENTFTHPHTHTPTHTHTHTHTHTYPHTPSCPLAKMYKGLDVITNKATPEEQEGIPHHLLGFLDPFSETNVVDFQARAQHAIDGILEKGKVCRKNHKKKLKPKVCKYTHTHKHCFVTKRSLKRHHDCVEEKSKHLCFWVLFDFGNDRCL